MSTINALIFSNSPKIDFKNDTYSEVNPPKELRSILSESFEPYSEFFEGANNVWQRKFETNQKDQVVQFLNELIVMRELKAVVYIQTSGAIFHIGELDENMNDWEFFLDYLIGWDEDESTLRSCGAEFFGWPDIAIKTDGISDPVRLLKETLDHIKNQKLPLEKQFFEWEGEGKFRLQINEDLQLDSQDPYYNSAGTYQLYKSL